MRGTSPTDPDWLTPSLSRGWGWYASRGAIGMLFVFLHALLGLWGILAGLVVVGLLLLAIVFLRATQITSGDRTEAVHFTLRVNEQPIADGLLESSAGSARRGHLLAAGAFLSFGLGVLAALPKVGVDWLLFVALTPLLMGLERLARGLAEEVPAGEPVPVDVAAAGRALMDRARAGGHGGRVEASHVREGRLDLSVSVVQQYSLTRFLAEQASLVFPLVMLAVTVLGMQLSMIYAIYAMLTAVPAGGGAPEPSAEYLTRLLNGDTAGKEQGVIAQPSVVKPDTETTIESYYLPKGSDGPITKPGGGRRTGAAPRSGDPRTQKAEEAVVKIEEVGTTEQLQPKEAPDVPTIDELADPLASADGKQEEFKESVEVTEGWGLTDWYDTKDARKDAKEIQRAIDLSNELLKLDPDNMYGLSIKAYYQYLAMNYDGATGTYQHMLQLDGTGGAEWNNLALVYKRLGDYKKEEELYHTAIMMEPNESNTYLNLALCLGHQGRFDEALQIMKKLETDIPEGDENEGYADLYRAQIYALMGRKEDAYAYLRKSLKLMRKLDTLHNIEFQQDIRVDPAFKEMREEPRFKRLLMRFYGDRPGGWWIPKGDDAKPEPGEDP